MLMKMKLLSILFLSCLFMVACGQKGPLYKSPEVQDNQSLQQADESTAETIIKKDQ